MKEAEIREASFSSRQGVDLELLPKGTVNVTCLKAESNHLIYLNTQLPGVIMKQKISDNVNSTTLE